MARLKQRSERNRRCFFLFKKHTGLYAYRREFLLEFATWPQAESEIAASLEQLRALERGVKIKVVEAASTSIGVDTSGGSRTGASNC